jgi:hypothetical protein
MLTATFQHRCRAPPLRRAQDKVQGQEGQEDQGRRHCRHRHRHRRCHHYLGRPSAYSEEAQAEEAGWRRTDGHGTAAAAAGRCVREKFWISGV